MNETSIPQNNTLDDLVRIARVLSANLPASKGGGYWRTIRDKIESDSLPIRTATDLLPIAQSDMRHLDRNGMTTTVTYDRREWLLLGEIGEVIAAFPAGEEGKTQAIIGQLQIEAPEAISLALDYERRRPEAEGRAIRAAQLIAANKVDLEKSVVHPQHSNEPPYRILDGWRCECPDARRGHNCKHAIAWHFARTIANDQARTRQFVQMVARGADPDFAAETIDAGFMDFEEWRQHYRVEI